MRSITLSSSLGGLLRIGRAPPARLTHGLHNNHRLTLRTSSPARRWLCSIFTLAQLVRLGKGLAGSCRIEHPPCRQGNPRQFRPVLGHEAPQSAKRAPDECRNADSGVHGHWALILILCDWLAAPCGKPHACGTWSGGKSPWLRRLPPRLGQTQLSSGSASLP